MDGKGLMLGVLIVIIALWGALMLSLASDSSVEGVQDGDCLSQENC